MNPKLIHRIALGLILAVAAPMPAHAQFGRLGDAVKKKAKEVGANALGKDSSEQKAAVPPPRAPRAPAPAQMLITADVLDRFTKSLSAEIAKRNLYVKREECVKAASMSNDFMQMLAASGQGMEAAMSDKLTDDQKMAAMTKFSEDLQKKQDAFLVKKCGAAIPDSETEGFEAVGAEAGGFTVREYGLLKERVIAYCEAAAHGSDTPKNSKFAFTDDEIAALRPRCPALLASLKKVS